MIWEGRCLAVLALFILPAAQAAAAAAAGSACLLASPFSMHPPHPLLAVKLWDGVKGTFVATFRGHVGPVYQVCGWRCVGGV